ncbi:MAG: hypothetical protein ABI347_02300 [Nitrososphaera sp.]|jgi:uncharacterized membrane protein YkoI
MDNPLTGTNRKAMMIAGVAVALLAAAAIAIPSALAQGTNSTQSGSTTVPDIKGSVSIQNATNAFVRDNVKVPLATALSTVQGQAGDNERVTGGQLAQVQGYLVYTFKVVNYDAGTYKVVIVDAGNGSVLYTSDSMTLHNGGLGCGGGSGWGHHHHFGGKMNWGNGDSSSSDNSNSSTQATTSA